MCPKPFSWAKNKRKLFSDRKSRGPLLAGAALKCSRLTQLDHTFCESMGSKIWNDLVKSLIARCINFIQEMPSGKVAAIQRYSRNSQNNCNNITIYTRFYTL